MAPEQTGDSLSRLEERILQAAELVSRLRREAEEARAKAARLSEEVDVLQRERQQVRARIETLLGKLDEFGGR